QMKKSLYYTASCSTIEEVESLMGYESSQSKDINNEFDVMVHMVVLVFCNKEKLQPFASNETGDSINEEFVNKVLFYEKICDFAHTAINKYMLHRDYEFVDLIKAYLEKIRVRKNELAEEQEATTDQDSIKNVESNIISIVNPRKVITKGRPKSASHNKNVVTTQKKSSKKCRQYTCEFCKKPDHNIATCPHKEK
ncbi:28408_t:CDS:2, partial [Racocetra persica]